VSTIAPPTKKEWTEEELQALPDNGFNHEVVDGELVMSPKNNFEHENICFRLSIAMQAFNEQHNLGVILGSSAGFWMHNRNCRAPDVSFITKARLRAVGFTTRTRRFFPGAPDLAVEVLSPNTSRREMNDRLRDFFSSGTQIAWLINPELETVEVCYALDNRKLIGPGAELDGEHLMPGFRFPLADLFRETSWS
jgi:Uma2 family endonuclease